VDQTWTRHRSPGTAAPAWRTLAGKVDPRRLPPTSEPRLSIALVGGALAGSGPGTSPCVDGLSLVTGVVVPQGLASSNHLHDGGGLGLRSALLEGQLKYGRSVYYHQWEQSDEWH
jgi:hypothetical protein